MDGIRSKGGEFKGRALIAVQDDSILVVYYGAPPPRFDQVRAKCEEALQTLVAPVKIPPRNEPPLPKQQETGRMVSEKLTVSVPMIRVLGRSREDTSLWAELGSGTGFVVRSDGYVVTNRHVVAAEGVGKFSRQSFDPLRLSWDQGLKKENILADVIAISLKDDLALLKMHGIGPWPAVQLADVANVKTGDRIVVVGWPSPGDFGETDINQNEGTLTAIQRDARGRPRKFRHSAHDGREQRRASLRFGRGRNRRRAFLVRDHGDEGV